MKPIFISLVLSLLTCQLANANMAPFDPSYNQREGNDAAPPDKPVKKEKPKKSEKKEQKKDKSDSAEESK